ncbi:AAA domain protein [uncultured archaeon]|nr:AAA domain protein [uncultured archaeon]
MIKRPSRIVFTGGPCSGKTTLLEQLALKGLTIVPETARIIIEQEQKRDSEILPWRNLYGFQEEVARVQLEQEHSYEGRHLFLDRGVVDGHGFSLNGKIPTPEIIMDFGKSRYNLVFLLDPLPNYKNDSSRKETPQMARKIHDRLDEAYRHFGYQPIRIPVLGSVEERANYATKLLERVL